MFANSEISLIFKVNIKALQMKKIISFTFLSMLVFVAALTFSCTKKAETSDSPQDSTAQPADTTEHPAEHPAEHPSEHPADSTK